MASLGVVRRQNSALQGGGRVGGNRKLGVHWGVKGGGGMGKRFLTAHSSYSRHQIPHNTFLSRTYHYFHISQPAKNCQKNRYFVEQIHWVPLSIIKKSSWTQRYQAQHILYLNNKLDTSAMQTLGLVPLGLCSRSLTVLALLTNLY